MGWIRSIFGNITEAQKPAEPNETVSVKDLLHFMEQQQSNNTELIKAVLEASNSQARTLESYIDLFKPRNIPSTTVDERETMTATKIRANEWEGVEDMRDFHRLTAGQFTEPSEY
jgi:hypothetical protein